MNQVEMNPEQIKEIAEHLESKLTDKEIKSLFVGIIFGMCEGNVEAVKGTIDYFEEEAQKLKG